MEPLSTVYFMYRLYWHHKVYQLYECLRLFINDSREQKNRIAVHIYIILTYIHQVYVRTHVYLCPQMWAGIATLKGQSNEIDHKIFLQSNSPWPRNNAVKCFFSYFFNLARVYILYCNTPPISPPVNQSSLSIIPRTPSRRDSGECLVTPSTESTPRSYNMCSGF